MTPSQEERLAVLETKVFDYNDRFSIHMATCGSWQQQISSDVQELKDAALRRLAWPWVIAFSALASVTTGSITLLVQHILSSQHIAG